MKKQFFTVNWRAVNQAISAKPGSEERKEFYAEFNKLKRQIDEKAKEQYRKQCEEERQEKIKALKNLQPGASVYYKGSDKRLLGKELKKMGDKIKYMLIQTEAGNCWKVAYASLQPEPLTDLDLRIRNIANRVFND